MSGTKEKIILLGAGGHAKVLIELIHLAGEYEIAGILDNRLEAGSVISGISVLGNDEMLAEIFAKKITNACIGVGSIKDTLTRTSLFKKLKGAGFSVPSLIHPDAHVSESAKLAEGVQIMMNSVLQAGCSIGENTIVNTGAIIEHDCTVGKDVHVCPGAVISGTCNIKEGTFIGAGSTVINNINIGKDVTIAAGSVVVSDIADKAAVKGAPAR